MATVTLDLLQRNRLAVLRAERMGLTPLARQTVLEEAGLEGFRTALHFDAEAASFAAQLVRELQARGTLAETGQPALISLLRWPREAVAGHENDAAFVDGLLAPYTLATESSHPSTPPLPNNAFRSDDAARDLVVRSSRH